MNDTTTLIALCGRAGSGKDTAADYLCHEYGFVREAFAGGLKAMCEALLTEHGIDYAWLYEPRLKERVIPEIGASARHLMQGVGTWGRQEHGADFWCKLLARRIGLHAGGTPVHDRIVITDLRYPEELAWARSAKAHVLKLRRTSAEPARPHSSEEHTESLAADETIDNEGPTVDGLHAHLDAIMSSHQISRRDYGFEWQQWA